MELLSSRFNLLIFDLLLPLMVGYYLRQHKLLKAEHCNLIVKFNIRFIYFFLSMLSFWNLKLTSELLFLPLLGILACAVPGVISRFSGYYFYHNYTDKGAYLMAAMLANIGTLGGLAAFILYGITGFAYVQLVGVFQNFFTLVVSFPLANYFYHKANENKNDRKISIMALLFNWNQLGVVGMILGMILSFNNIPQPHFALTAFNIMVHLGAWGGLLPVGYMMEFGQARQYMVKTLDLAVVKFLVWPLLTYGMVSYLFPENKTIIGALTLCCTTPIAINAVLAANLYKLNVNITIASFIVTTTIFMLLIFPLFYFWGQYHL